MAMRVMPVPIRPGTFVAAVRIAHAYPPDRYCFAVAERRIV